MNAVGVQLVGGHRAHTPQPAHRQRMQKCQFPIRRHQEQSVGLGLLAGDLGEELSPGHSDGDGQADLLTHVGAQPRRDLDRGPAEPAQPADIEERLVHRERFHHRCAMAKHREHRLAGPGVCAHPRRHHHGVWTQPARLSATHRGAHAVGLGLVAGRQHDSAADDHRAAPQCGVVTLLDGGVERIQVRVQDGSLIPHEHMFAAGYDSRRWRGRHAGRVAVASAVGDGEDL